LLHTQAQLVELYQSSKSNVSEHIKHIVEEGELQESLVVRKFGNSEFSTKPTNFYNLDVIISVSYRVKSVQGTHFHIWVTERLREYIVKGFTMDDARLQQGGGEVLDLYAESVDYDPKSKLTLEFFKIVQNKLHYAAHGHTAAEVIFERIDADKPFLGLTNFAGALPTKKRRKQQNAIWKRGKLKS
jgi:hypothetical protein